MKHETNNITVLFTKEIVMYAIILIRNLFFPQSTDWTDNVQFYVIYFLHLFNGIGIPNGRVSSPAIGYSKQPIKDFKTSS